MASGGSESFGAMKVAMVGVAIGLAAAGGCTTEMPNATRAGEPVGVGGPIPLTPAPAPASAGAALVSPVSPSVPAPSTYPTRYPVTVFNPYYPHWVVEVFGR